MTIGSIFLGMIGWGQGAILILVILLFFGAKRIPELMRGLGSGIKEFKDATRGDEKDNTPKDELDSKK